MKTKLNEVEMMTINMLANLRGIGARIKGVRDAKVSDKNNSEIDFEGLLGEYAFCKMFNLFFEISPMPRSGSYDCIWNGRRIDLKTTTYLDGSLLGNVKRNEDVDVYVLCTIDIQRHGVEVCFPGWLYSEELYDSANLTTLRGSPVYLVKQDKLNAF